jgi:hypothetical protein
MQQDVQAASDFLDLYKDSFTEGASEELVAFGISLSLASSKLRDVSRFCCESLLFFALFEARAETKKINVIRSQLAFLSGNKIGVVESSVQPALLAAAKAVLG